MAAARATRRSNNTGFFIVMAGCVALMLLFSYIALTLPTHRPHHSVPVDQRIGGVAHCTASSVRIVEVPAGATTAFSCPTHIVVTSEDAHTPTLLAFRRPPKPKAKKP